MNDYDSTPSPGKTLWQPPPPQLVLRSHEVHLWRVSLDQPSEAFALSEDEQQRADRFRRDLDRQHFRVGRGVLREILGRYLGMAPAEVQFGYGAHGKPFLVNAADLQFNLSHSHGLALYAVGRDRRVGVDVEYLPRALTQVEPLAQRFFLPSEYKDLMALPAEHRQMAFLRLWTGKEAVLKAIGTGLSELEQVELPAKFLQDNSQVLLTTASQTIARWSLWSLNPLVDYVGALAVEGEGWRLSCWHLDSALR